MENVTPGEIWTWISAIATAVVLLANAAEKLAKAWQTAKAPNARQNERLDDLENHVKEIDGFLRIDKRRLDALDDGNRVTQRALLALLSHGIDGNNIDQMKQAENALKEHLINQ